VALIGSGSRLYSHARGKQVGAGTWGALMLGWNSQGRQNNRGIAEGGQWGGGKSAVPVGHLHPSAWLLPRQSGGLAGRTSATLTTAGIIAGGLNAEGSTTMALTTPPADARLVGLLSGATTMTLTTSGTIGGAVLAQGSTSMSLSTSGAISAGAHLAGATSMLLSTSASVIGIAYLVGEEEGGDLTPDAIATAVWAAVAAANNTAGTMGEKLNDAGGAADPWDDARALTVGRFIGLFLGLE
jgi:hypothetical protein